MKICPVCNRTYPNSSLNYCLDDGTTLDWAKDTPETLANYQKVTTPTEAFANTAPVTSSGTRAKSAPWMWILLILGGLITMCSISVAVYSLMSNSKDSKTDNGTANSSNISSNSSDLNLNTNADKNAVSNTNTYANVSIPEIPKNDLDEDEGNSNLTMEKYLQCREGISYKQATAILGKGNETSMSKGGGVSYNSYEWRGDKKSISLRFENDKLVSRMQSQIIKKVNPNLKLAKFSQLKEGMSYKETESILGSEGIETRRSFNSVNSVSFDWYGDKFVYLNVNFENDKLTRKSQFGLK